ncbi:hypothetical protein ACNKHT_11480 [Shigella flexneri]
MLRLLDRFADKIPAELLTALKSDATPEVRREQVGSFTPATRRCCRST